MKVELAKQLDELYVVFGLRCLSVLRYLTDHIGVLSLGVLARSFSKFAQRFPLLSDMFKRLQLMIKSWSVQNCSLRHSILYQQF